MANLLKWDAETRLERAIIDFDGELMFAAYAIRLEGAKCKALDEFQITRFTAYESVCFFAKHIALDWESRLMNMDEESMRDDWINACLHEEADANFTFGDLRIEVRPGGGQSSSVEGCSWATKLLFPNDMFAAFKIPLNIKETYFIQRQSGYAGVLALSKEHRVLTKSSYLQAAEKGELLSPPLISEI